MRLAKRISVFIVAVISMFGCSGDFPRRVPDDRVYTLYRNSVIDPAARIHIATFDADEAEHYNQENCDVARGLFASQAGVTTQFHCEKGYFRK